MTIPAYALTAILTLQPMPPPATSRPSHLRELARRFTPIVVKARDHLGHKGAGVLLKVTLWRF
jgi:hypothetical protein